VCRTVNVVKPNERAEMCSYLNGSNVNKCSWMMCSESLSNKMSTIIYIYIHTHTYIYHMKYAASLITFFHIVLKFATIIGVRMEHVSKCERG
jgi:hypothetical protein